MDNIIASLRFCGASLAAVLTVVLTGCGGQLSVTEIDPQLASGTTINGMPFRIKERYQMKLYHLNRTSRSYELVKDFHGVGTTGQEGTHVTLANPDRLFVLQFHGDALADSAPSFTLNADGTLKTASIETTADHSLEAVKELTKQIDEFKKVKDAAEAPPADQVLISALETKHAAENAVIAFEALGDDATEEQRRDARQTADAAKLKANLAARQAELPLPYPGFQQ